MQRVQVKIYLLITYMSIPIDGYISKYSFSPFVLPYILPSYPQLNNGFTNRVSHSNVFQLLTILKDYEDIAYIPIIFPASKPLTLDVKCISQNFMPF